MSVDVHSELVIERPRTIVGDFMFNPKCDQIWISGLKKVFPLSAGNLSKGAKVEHVGDFLGKYFSAVLQVIRDEPHAYLELSADEPFEMKIRYELKDFEAGTRVKIRVQSVGELNFRQPPSIVSNAAKEKIVTDLRKLKKHLEENAE